MRSPFARTISILAITAILATGLLVATLTNCLTTLASYADTSGEPPFLGITYLEMSAQAAAHHPGCVEGAFVTAVRPGGAAELAGLAPGDTIIGIDGQPLAGEFALIQRLMADRAAGPMVLSVRRGDQTLSLSLAPTNRP
jgi:S1-C subfamily serine protease